MGHRVLIGWCLTGLAFGLLVTAIAAIRSLTRVHVCPRLETARVGETRCEYATPIGHRVVMNLQFRAVRGRTRSAAAGAAAAAVRAFQEPLDERLVGCDYSDVAVLGKALTNDRGWWPVGFAVHVRPALSSGLPTMRRTADGPRALAPWGWVWRWASISLCIHCVTSSTASTRGAGNPACHPFSGITKRSSRQHGDTPSLGWFSGSWPRRARDGSVSRRPGAMVARWWSDVPIVHHRVAPVALGGAARRLAACAVAACNDVDRRAVEFRLRPEDVCLDAVAARVSLQPFEAPAPLDELVHPPTGDAQADAGRVLVLAFAPVVCRL